MDPADIARVAEWLRSEIGVPFVVVGGSAVERIVPVATKDVDVLIDRGDWPTVDSKLESNSEASPLEPTSGNIRGTVLAIGGTRLDLEFISDEPFSDTRGEGAFTKFVRERGSVLQGGVRYAIPAVVFYMRMNAPESPELYSSSIERDILAGVPESTLDEAVRIAEQFGRGAQTASQANAVRSNLRARDPRRK
jgi:hypothetical protein